MDFGKVLTTIGVGLFAKRVLTGSTNLLKMAGSMKVANSSLRSYNALTAVAVASSNALAASISRIIWPIALISGAATAIKLFGDNSEVATHDAANLRAEIEGLQKGFIDTSIASLQYQRSLARPDFKEFISQSKELAALQKDLQEAQERQEDRGFIDLSFGEDSVATLKEQIRQLKMRRSELEENTKFYAELTERIEEQVQALEEAEDSAEDYSESLKALANLDPVFSASRQLRKELSQIGMIVEDVGISEQHAARLREEAYERYREDVHDAISTTEELDDTLQSVFGQPFSLEGITGLEVPPEIDEIPENFAQKFKDQLEGIGDSLGDAFIDGDYESVGQSIGDLVGEGITEALSGDLGKTLGGVLGESISDSLSKSIGDSLGGQVGQGIGQSLGTVLGSAVGGAVGAAVGQAAGSFLDDVFGSDEYDLEAVQARQGTGTVLGDINAKSGSIDNSLEEIRSATDELVNINTGMLRSLQQVQNGIARASGVVARDTGDVQFSPGVGVTQDEQALRGARLILFGAIGGILGEAVDSLGIGGPFRDITAKVVGFVDDIFFGVFSSIGSAVFGGDRSIVDEGIRIVGGRITDLVDEVSIQAFARVKEEGGWFSSDDYFTLFKDLQQTTNDQFAAVFRNILGSVTAGAEALGVLPGEIQRRLDNFVVRTRQISLKNLGADRKAEEINAVFSSIFDRLARSVVPFLTDFQNAGEGLGETMARLATQVGLLEEFAMSLGTTITGITGAARPAAAVDLAERLGGTEQFAQAISRLETNFFSASQQLETNARRLRSALGSIPLPSTREGFLNLAKSQDLSTASGRENIATILQLQTSADDYYSALERQEEERIQREERIAQERESLERRILELQGETQKIRELEIADLDSSNRSLQRRIFALQDEKEEQRELSNIYQQQVSVATSLADAWKDATKTLREAADEILGVGTAGGLSIQAQFQQTLQRALAGEQEAFRELPGLGQELSEFGTQQAGSLADARRQNAIIAADLDKAADFAEKQFNEFASEAEIAQQQLDSLKSQEESLNDVSAEVRMAREALERLQGIEQASGVGFADGGIASGPESGFQATLHGTEAVIPLNGQRIPLEVNNQEMVQEIRELRTEVKQLKDNQEQSQYELVKFTKRNNRQFEQWDIDGLPPAREEL